MVERGSRTILAGASVALEAGEFVVLLGPSGSGKSTLMKSLAGIVEADAGHVELEGTRISELAPKERARQIGVVPQDDIVHRGLRVEDVLRYSARLRLPSTSPPELIDGRVEAVLRVTELGDLRRQRVRRLSGGQRKRVSLGVELLDSPRYLFLDEPTSGLDPALEEDTMALFARLAAAGHGVLASTHAMASLDRADELLVVMDGRIIFFGPPAAAPGHFGVAHPSEIFRSLRTAEAEQWQRRFHGTPLRARSLGARRGEARPVADVAPGARSPTALSAPATSVARDDKEAAQPIAVASSLPEVPPEVASATAAGARLGDDAEDVEALLEQLQAEIKTEDGEGNG
jgi:ABC transport system ATP-binding/permease protein